VQETLLGAPTHEVTVVVEGGVDMNRKHPIAMSVPDAPMLHRDEHVALLLKRGGVLGDAAYNIVGFNQGRINVDPPAAQLSAARTDVAADHAARTQRISKLRTKLQQAIAARGQPPSEATRSVQPLRPANPQRSNRGGVTSGR
jgi:hypothetical protein